MSDIEAIAKQNINAALDKRISALPNEIQAIQRELSPRGLVRSGAMLKKVRSACCSTLDAQATTVLDEYKWAVSHALYVTKPWADQLTAEASGSLEALRGPVKRTLEEACSLAGRHDLFDRLYNEYQSKEAEAKSDVARGIEAKREERRRGLVRAIPSFLRSLITRIVGGS